LESPGSNMLYYLAHCFLFQYHRGNMNRSQRSGIVEKSLIFERRILGTLVQKCIILCI
jgi:hypothetical protein